MPFKILLVLLPFLCGCSPCTLHAWHVNVCQHHVQRSPPCNNRASLFPAFPVPSVQPNPPPFPSRCEVARSVPTVKVGAKTPQGSAKRRAPGLVNFVTANHFCLNLPAAFTQPGNHPLAEPYDRRRLRCHSTLIHSSPPIPRAPRARVEKEVRGQI